MPEIETSHKLPETESRNNENLFEPEIEMKQLCVSRKPRNFSG